VARRFAPAHSIIYERETIRQSGSDHSRAAREQLECKGWHQEAAMRMLMNNLDPDVAENPDSSSFTAGTGRAARSWDAFDAIVRSLRELKNDESLLIQSGKPVGKFRTHDEARAF